LWGLKLLNWFRWNTGTMNTDSARVSGSDWAQRLSSLFVFGVCVAGCVFGWPRKKRWILFATVLMLANAFGHALFISRYRYRLPFEPLLLLVGLCGLFREGRQPSSLEAAPGHGRTDPSLRSSDSKGVLG
jgi:hypothetical protein